MKNYGNRIDEDAEMYNYTDDVDMNVFKNNFDENEVRKNSAKDINDQTMINLNSGNPVGLDINKFMSNINACEQTVHGISTSNDLPIISEVILF
jgi:hypothetical protein